MKHFIFQRLVTYEDNFNCSPEKIETPEKIHKRNKNQRSGNIQFCSAVTNISFEFLPEASMHLKSQKMSEEVEISLLIGSIFIIEMCNELHYDSNQRNAIDARSIVILGEI